MKSYFLANVEEFKKDPVESITEMVSQCDLSLTGVVDVSLSGTTAIIVFIYNSVAHVGCIGDSRAVLGKPGTPS